MTSGSRSKALRNAPIGYREVAIEDGYLSRLMPAVRQQLRIDATKRRYVHDPAAWAWDMLGVRLWSKQIEIATSVKNNPRTAVAAGHGVGKSFVAGVIALWWWDTHPLSEIETFVATTAPSKDQVDLIWSTIRTFHSLMHIRFTQGLIDHELPGYITGDNKYKLKDGQMLGQGRKPPDSKSDVAFQGRHATYLLAIGDEAVGLTGGFLNALEVIATGRENRVLLLANPTDPSCAMAKLWPDPEGRGGNPDWTLIHISVLDSPLITGEWDSDETVIGMSDMKFVEKAKVRYGGEDDPRYVARVLGQWAWDNGVGLFPEEVIARATRTRVIPDPERPNIRFGVDVARMGVDSTQVYECQDGWVWETDPETDEPVRNTEVPGLWIRYVDSWSKVRVTSKDPEHPGSAQKLDKLAIEYGAQALNIDAGGGLGAGLFDALLDVIEEENRNQSYAIFEVDGSTMKNIDRRSYLNLRAWAFSELKRRMNAGEIDLTVEDFDLLEEFRGIRAKIVNGSTLQIESKEDMKKRGAKSPDRVDAVWYSTLDSLGISEENQVGDRVVLDPVDAFDQGNEFYRGSAFGW